jgi:hypothetical protein
VVNNMARVVTSRGCNQSQQIELHRSAKDLLTGNELFGIAALDPYGVLVLV